jgi:hypothetical protein
LFPNHFFSITFTEQELCMKQVSLLQPAHNTNVAVLRCVVLSSPAGVLARQGSAGSMDDSSPAAVLQHNPAGLSRMRSARTAHATTADLSTALLAPMTSP